MPNSSHKIILKGKNPLKFLQEFIFETPKEIKYLININPQDKGH